MKKIPLLLLCLILLLTSCSKPEPTETPTTAAETTAAEEVQTTTEAKIMPNLPETKYDGYEYKIISKGKFSGHWSALDISAESENGDAINDAVYKRNLYVMEKYGVKIKEIANFEDPSGPAKKSILANTDEYDLLVITMAQLGSFAASGYLMDLNKIENVDLAKPWYDQNANEQLSVLGKLYVTTGELTIMDKNATWSVLFNKKIAQESGVEDLYKCVKEGRWTTEKMHETAKLGVRDLDGDGAMTAADQWGVLSENFNAYALCIGGGGRIVDKGTDDKPYFSIVEQKLIDAFMEAYELQSDANTTLIAQKFASGYKDVYLELIDKSFADDKALFNFAGLNRVTLFRNMATDFGILPVPKQSETQEGYHSIVSQWSSCGISIPKTATDPARTGIILEALSAESLYTLTPAYYDITLKTKSARDEESSEMLDIIFGSRVFDLGLMYGWGNFTGAIEGLVNANDTGIASKIEKSLPGAQKALDKFLTAYEAFE